MTNSTPRLITLRLFNLTLGRIGWIAIGFRRLLVWALIKRRSDIRYLATSRFFTWQDLNER